jgi:hypothetical protein
MRWTRSSQLASSQLASSQGARFGATGVEAAESAGGYELRPEILSEAKDLCIPLFRFLVPAAAVFGALQFRILRLEGSSMEALRPKPFWAIFVAWMVLSVAKPLAAEPVSVRHFEGVSFGFLVLRNLDGQPLAYGNLQQVVKSGVVSDDLQLRFKDGSFYEEITKFTQHGEFRLVSDQVVQKGPSFKQETESWIDAATGKITVRTVEKGKDKDQEKQTTRQLALPADVSNGLLFTLVKNLDPSAETTVSMVAASTKPRLVKLHIVPGLEKTIRVGLVSYKAQHYIVKTKIEGAAGVIAPLVGKQPPEIHIWILKSEAPTFVEFEGPLSEDGPIWRIEMAAPEPDSPKAK